MKSHLFRIDKRKIFDSFNEFMYELFNYERLDSNSIKKIRKVNAYKKSLKRIR
jgi:hypothetical protein